ncbi:HNH endonuclease protein [Rhizobium phage RHph_TM39]|uniref:HNH endonuclease protein n=2 Tax=Cuauhnahuacvirus TaxID=3044696 RepID=A0A7S5UXF2_9CAUD|nr:HNH endonuclease [Rhizobium phage RHph_TM30]YP_010671395.1 HNH endonuclease [Rhizobium phage RHph_Y65]QIG71717.1 HNH endonuclease protein [Rhizobium phage RHph_TM40]QIG72080.1 HNH endonuclease protein [Rhizobium phage RHph_TM2_3B]QIG72442.1 HNH endonuclease protein [Rhizobium phage RHph_TM3_3_6]QIG77218.1 HNH endonuclease protein [Rhizobium phage RHph_TM39]QIG77524.1 HNH endonuclease protein [Rhizobium phage RHph_TM21B]QIG77832.1 HNH endonuclease protein [Rhizobium phage RHph_TM61]
MHTADLENMPSLVLNADMLPLSSSPLSLYHWHDTIKAVTENKASVIAEYDRVIRSPTFEMKLPSVIALNNYVGIYTEIKFTRYNLFLRDKFTCQYCMEKFAYKNLTFDHVVPASRGGKTVWTNIVAACHPCNIKKRDRTPEEAGLHLHYKPYAPNYEQFKRLGRQDPGKNHYGNLHKTIIDWLYWDTELESK